MRPLLPASDTTALAWESGARSRLAETWPSKPTVLGGFVPDSTGASPASNLPPAFGPVNRASPRCRALCGLSERPKASASDKWPRYFAHTKAVEHGSPCAVAAIPPTAKPTAVDSVMRRPAHRETSLRTRAAGPRWTSHAKCANDASSRRPALERRRQRGPATQRAQVGPLGLPEGHVARREQAGADRGGGADQPAPARHRSTPPSGAIETPGGWRHDHDRAMHDRKCDRLSARFRAQLARRALQMRPHGVRAQADHRGGGLGRPTTRKLE